MKLLNKIIVCSHGSNVSEWIDTWYSTWRKGADEIYLLLDNCTDDSTEKAQRIAEQDFNFHYFYRHYTFFRFAVVRNDLFQLIPDEFAFYLFPCMDQLPVTENWKEYMLSDLQEHFFLNSRHPFFVKWKPTTKMKDVENELILPFSENIFDGLSGIYNKPSKIFNLNSNAIEFRHTSVPMTLINPRYQWFKHFRKKVEFISDPKILNWSPLEAHLCQIEDILLGQNPSFDFFTDPWFLYVEDIELKNLLLEFWICNLIDNIQNTTFSAFVKNHIDFVLKTAVYCFEYLEENKMWSKEKLEKNKKAFLQNMPSSLGRYKIEYFKEYL